MSSRIPDEVVPMRVGVVGTGHAGLITCTSLAAVGHHVVGCDADPEKVSALVECRMPYHEQTRPTSWQGA